MSLSQVNSWRDITDQVALEVHKHGAGVYPTLATQDFSSILRNLKAQRKRVVLFFDEADALFGVERPLMEGFLEELRGLHPVLEVPVSRADAL